MIIRRNRHKYPQIHMKHDTDLTKMTRHGAYGIVYKKGMLLLIKQKGGPYAGKYDLPGGGIEFGESPEQALRREFIEEVACEFKSCTLVDNLTATIDVLQTTLNPTYTFHHIGMIYRVDEIYFLEDERPGELQRFWTDPAALQKEECSSLLWQVITNYPLNINVYLGDSKATRWRIVDLTHSLEENMPSWEGSCGFYQKTICDYTDCTVWPPFRIQGMNMDAGIGTHIDAPAHCVPNAATVDQLPLSSLIAPCVVIDVSQKAHEHYSVSELDILRFEEKYSPLTPGQFVMIRTGWEQYWNEPGRYHNNHLFPSVSQEAAALLVARQIVGLGIDTLSPDRPQDGYPVHGILLGAGKYIVENVANLAILPPTGSEILVLPIKIKDGTEAPVRLLALLAR
jgi:kynurenine formamidase/8-oxo-dGTP pyrophosphatase MutT (NUDIX family)